MINTVAAQFLLLIQHPYKNKLIAPDIICKSGTIGAILMDLLHQNLIRIEEGKLITTANETDLSLTHLQVLEQINQISKPKKISSWISKLSKNSKRYQKQLFEDLEQQLIIQIFRKKFLFFPYYRTHLYNTKAQTDLIKELRELVFSGKPLELTHPMIPGIIHSCRLHKLICYDRKERRICRKRLKDYMLKDPIAKNTDKVIRQMQMAINAAVSSAATAGAAAGH